MNLLIDGHNLIPKVRGLTLAAMDDEMTLIEILEDYCRLKRCRVEVFFDRAAPGRAGKHSYGMVIAHFVSEKSTADAAIYKCLRSIGKNARNISVVTSDRQVQSEARSFGATVIKSEDFAGELMTILAAGEISLPKREMNDQDIDEWLSLFGADKD